MAIETYQFMNKESVKYLLDLLFTKTNVRIDQRIVNSISASSSDKQVLSAEALYDLIATMTATDNNLAGRLDANDTKLSELGEQIVATQESKGGIDDKITEIGENISDLSDVVEGLNHLTIQVVEGKIETVVAEPKSDVLYIQRDSAEDPSWMIYVYTEGNGWVCVGDTELDLSNYWSKDDVADMREALGVHEVEALSDADITDSVETSFDENAPDLRVKPTGIPAIVSTIAAGSALSAHPISGDMTHRAKVVPGTFSWVTTDEEFVGVAGDSVEATWMFTPDDQVVYAPVTGKVVLTIA
jgi:hypothetical protein